MCRAVLIVPLTRRRGETGYCICASFWGPLVGGCQDPQHEVSLPTLPLPYLAIPHPGACSVDWTVMNFWRPSMRMVKWIYLAMIPQCLKISQVCSSTTDHGCCH